MASILNPGALQPNQGGLFGSYSAPAGGIFSALKDAAAYLGGGGSTDNFAQYNAQNQQAQMRQQLLQGLTSEDPAMRSQAYSTAALLGIDTKPIQQQMAAQALPKLLQSMQPSTQTVAPTSAPLPNLPGQSVQGGGFSFQAPGLSTSEALAQSNSPELQTLYAPKLLDTQIAADAEANKPYTLEPGATRYVNGQATATGAPKQGDTPEDQFIAQQLKQNPNADLSKLHGLWAKAGHVEDSTAAGWQVVNDPTTNQPYRYNARTSQATDLAGKPIQVGGFGKLTTNNPRSAVGIYMEQWKQEHPKASAADIATAMNTFSGQQAEQHALGTISARVGSANNGLDSVLDQANAAYAKLPRGSFAPFNKLQQMAATNAFSTPEQADAYAADTGAINMWAKSINPSGVLTVENARRGEQMLSQAQSPEAHQAVIERMRKEGQAAKAGVDKSRGIAPTAQALPQLPPKAPAGTTETKVLGGKTYYKINGQWHQ